LGGRDLIPNFGGIETAAPKFPLIGGYLIVHLFGITETIAMNTGLPNAF
jgi:hypothetical protein